MNNAEKERQDIDKHISKHFPCEETQGLISSIFNPDPKRDYQHEAESRIADTGEPPIDLSAVDPTEHHQYDYRELCVPENVRAQLERCTFPLTREEANKLCDEMEKHHRTAPLAIQMDEFFRQTGELYQSNPHAREYKTGFHYLHPQ